MMMMMMMMMMKMMVSITHVALLDVRAFAWKKKNIGTWLEVADVVRTLSADHY